MNNDEDEAALLAELRAISSGSHSRFGDEASSQGVDTRSAAAAVAPTTATLKTTAATIDSSKPAAEKLSSWRKTLSERISQPPSSPVTANKKTNTTMEPAASTKEGITASVNGSNIMHTTSTFQGERGGDANDAELLAELRGISSKSGSSRFDDYDSSASQPSAPVMTVTSESIQQSSALSVPSPSSKSPRALPPWKRGKQAAVITTDVVVAAPAISTSGFQSEVPSTFTGDRGGAANDAELLAELRGISSKSGSSRFDDYDSSGGASQPFAPVTATSESLKQSPALPEPFPSLKSPRALPPWKRGKQTAVASEPVDIVASSAPSTRGFQSNGPSTFAGERGGDANDAELLAELRDISSKSGSSRFGDESNAAANASMSATAPVTVASDSIKPSPALPVTSPSSKSPRLPPWKRNKLAAVPSDTVEVVSSPTATSTSGFQLNVPSTFTGERGGDANDAELLAELRGISSKSGSSRFDDDSSAASMSVSDPVTAASQSVKPSPALSESSPSSKSSRAPPPWKRNKQAAVPSEAVDVVASSTSPSTSGFQSNVRSTFTGERGGDANDAELLAELRGISSQSGSSRFDDVGTTSVPVNAASIPADRTQAQPIVSPPLKSQGALPPWKRGKQASLSPKAPDVVETAQSRVSTKGFQSDLPSTFTGERGGDANDPELLALLRGASSNFGASRFDDETTTPGSLSEAKEPMRQPPLPTTSSSPQNISLPPWKLTKQAAVSPKIADVVVAAQSPPTKGFRSDAPFTFTGERGGDANDPELLALLRGASTSGASRFDDTTAGNSAASGVVPQLAAQQVPRVSQDIGIAGETAEYSSTIVGDEEDTKGLAQGDLPNALTDKNWKIRAEAFDALSLRLVNIVDGRQDVYNVDANLLIKGLDDMMPSLLEESNAGALDKALSFALLYAEHCECAASPERARAMVSALINKNGFSGRPGTSKLAASLCLKLMEVGSVPSINSVLDVLLSGGLASKKPKVVQAAVTLILDATLDFGASVLPLASISKSASSLLTNSNVKVREVGLAILAEICRGLGSRKPIQGIIDDMKPTQAKELDALLEGQPDANQPRRRLRNQQVGKLSVPVGDPMAAFQAGTAELAAQRYAARPTINLMAEVAKSDFAVRLALPKWSEKVAALNIVLECAGEAPYKLAEQSQSCNHISLVNEMKKLLSHTHFAVVSKAMEVLSMLAVGVGEKLFGHLRPLLVPLLLLSKDKKLAKAVSSCLDSFFGNVLSFDHLLDQDDALPDAVDEHKQKNALVRVAALELVTRCVRRAEEGGPRSALNSHSAKRIASLSVDKLEDSNAEVRKAASDILATLLNNGSPEVGKLMVDVMASLETRNPRAHKSLSNTSAPSGVASKGTKPKGTSKPMPSVNDPTSSVRPLNARTSKQGASKLSSDVAPQSSSPPETEKIDGFEAPMSMSSALARMGKLPLSSWGAPEDDGGILKGLESAKGIMRQDAIKSLTSFVESGKLITSEDISSDCMALLVVVREHTRGFNETNVNIMKGVVQLFLAICDVHEKLGVIVNGWMCRNGAGVAIAKISDKKASDGCKTLLTTLCGVCPPHEVLLRAFEALESAKSPIAHEEYLKWVITFCGDFGAQALGPHVGSLIPFFLSEMTSPNVKVRRDSLNGLGVIHSHLGGQFRALVMSLSKGPVREQVETCFESYPFDAANQSKRWPKTSLALSQLGGSNGNGITGLVLDMPKTDLFQDLADDIISRLGSKDGKTAWKQRKEALEEVEVALRRCSGLIETSGNNLRPIVDLARALEQRLTDTQINLKPVASSVITRLLSVLDKSAQAKVGKIVFSQLINSAMNDIKKPMRDSCLTALKTGVTSSALDGGGTNVEALEVLVSSMIGEVNEASTRAGGLGDVLLFLLSMVESLPNLDDITSSRGQALGERYALMIVECLTSSKTETRSAATLLVESSIESGVASTGSFRKAAERLKPAQQRTIGPMISQFTKRTSPASESGKENDKTLVKPLVEKGPRAHEDAVHSSLAVPKQLPTPGRKSASPAGDHPTPLHSRSSKDNPLIIRGGSQKSAIPNQLLAWPAFPEEPQGASLLLTLKRAWSPYLPPLSAITLFPETGIHKQDDGIRGVALLKEALVLDYSENQTATELHLDFIAKWVSVVLCSRETTVGLISLLDYIEDLLRLLLDRNYSITDSQAVVLVPFIIERAGVAKGRFQEKYLRIETLLQNEQILSTKQLGALACVTVMENSSQAKARAYSCRLCRRCLEKDGLASIGKKAVTVAAKAVSDETIPDNRSAALEFVEYILFRMNGDFQKFLQICGPSLSAHALQLVEERWHKRDKQPSYGSEPAQLPSPDHARGVEEKKPVQARDRGMGADAAATLRARLQAVRGKGVEPDETPANETAADVLELTYSCESIDVEMLYMECIIGLKSLTTLAAPVADESTVVQTAIDGLKRFHAALTKQQKPSSGYSVVDLVRLRQIIVEHLDETMEQLTKLIRFAFEFGDPTLNAGLSIPLLSVCLATLMALFRDSDIATKVSQDQLGLLIREAGSALLDSRLSSNSDIDESTGSQMVRAINKLAVQAATAAERHTSILALLAVQQQVSLAIDDFTSEDDDVFKSRLSRVLSKLFARVLKTEESVTKAFTREDFDLEAVLCGLEDYLVACSAVPRTTAIARVEACSDMAKTLIESLLRVHGPEALSDLIEELELLESAELVLAMIRNERMASILPIEAQLAPTTRPIESYSAPPIEPVILGVHEARFPSITAVKAKPETPKRISSLVSALVSAQSDAEREAARNALSEYEQLYGDGDLKAHLQQVSSPFRAFIEGQMNGSATFTAASQDDNNEGNESMTARLRSLRTRLAATETLVQTAVTTKPSPATCLDAPANESPADLVAETTPSFPPDTRGKINLPINPPSSKLPSPMAQQRRSSLSRLTQPSPSKLTQPSPSKIMTGASSQSLRDRLAASAQGRAAPTPHSPKTLTSTTMSRAAALRARLEAVKSLQNRGQGM